MIKTFTQDDVVRHLYNETSKNEEEEMVQALLCDTDFESTYNELSNVKSQLDIGFREPSDKVVNSIIDYSRKR